MTATQTCPGWCRTDHTDTHWWHGDHRGELHKVIITDDQFVISASQFVEDKELMIELAGRNGHQFLMTRRQAAALARVLTELSQVEA